MRRLRSIILAAAAAMALAGCSDSGDHKPEVTGSAYEILVVADKAEWSGPVGDTLRSVLQSEVPMTNQPEPLFSLAQTTPKGYTGLLIKHRNIIMVNQDEKAVNPSLSVQYDVNARPQIIVYATGATQEQIAAYISEHRDELVHIFEMSERDRDLAFFTKYTELTIQNTVKEKFGFEMTIPRGYLIRNQKKDFMWISYELRLASQGIIIYTYPYTGKSDFTVDALTARRNQFVGMIPGPSENSFMTTADIEPDVEYLRINGRFWAEMRGLWNVQNDFMGGPFVSYSTLDTENNRVVAIDMYVYSPKNPKRNYLRQLEHLINTVKFPGDPTQEK